MKKIMMAMAVALSAAMVHASAVTWGVANGGSLDSSKIATGTFFLCYTADASGINWGALSTMSTFDESTIAKVGFEKVVSSFDYSSSKVNTKDTITPKSTGLTAGSKNFYMICIDSDGTDIAYTVAPKAINVAASAMTVAAGLAPSAFSYATTQVVPEPTSGLLLLLGMASLALRRKQA